MRAPLLRGQAAPVLPFRVLPGKRRPHAIKENPLDVLRGHRPELAAVIDQMIDKWVKEIEAEG